MPNKYYFMLGVCVTGCMAAFGMLRKPLPISLNRGVRTCATSSGSSHNSALLQKMLNQSYRWGKNHHSGNYACSY